MTYFTNQPGRSEPVRTVNDRYRPYKLRRPSDYAVYA